MACRYVQSDGPQMYDLFGCGPVFITANEPEETPVCYADSDGNVARVSNRVEIDDISRMVGLSYSGPGDWRACRVVQMQTNDGKSHAFFFGADDPLDWAGG